MSKKLIKILILLFLSIFIDKFIQGNLYTIETIVEKY